MGCDVDAAPPCVVVETEQKFLVDAAAFEAVKPSARRQHIRQCYVALGEGAGWEVRFREVAREAVDLGACDVCWKKPGRCWNCSYGISEHPCHHCNGEGRRVTPRTITYTQTLKRLRGDSTIARDEIEFPVSAEVFDTVWSASAWRVEKDRYTLGDWQVDVFATGPLRSVAVAEMELPEESAGVADFLAASGRSLPHWLVVDVSECGYIDLTAERVNLVACGAVEASPRLRRILEGAAATTATATSVTPRGSFPEYLKRPATPKLTRQGVRDLGYSKRGGVL